MHERVLMYDTKTAWIYFDKEKHIKNISKFLYLEHNETKKRFLICGTFPIINHKDFEKYFSALDYDDFNEYKIIGSGDMNNGIINGFSSIGYKIKTQVDVAQEIYDLLEKPKLSKLLIGSYGVLFK